MEHGVHEEAEIFASDASHYCRYNIAGLLGLGSKGLISIPTDTRNAMDIVVLGEQARSALRRGKRIAAIIATLGTTEAFGLDDMQGLFPCGMNWLKSFSFRIDLMCMPMP